MPGIYILPGFTAAVFQHRWHFRSLLAHPNLGLMEKTDGRLFTLQYGMFIAKN